MPFLLPAVSAALCDIAIVYLSRSDGIYRETLEEESLTRLVYQSGYVLPTAAIRLFLLMIPLPYHSYNGTALKFSYLYQILYIGTLLTLLIHMLSLGMVDPSSLSSLVKTAPTMEELAVRHLWSILSLSLTSNLCHILLFLHVRSTAPADNAELGRAKVLLYYVKEREDTELDSLLGQQIERPNSDASNRMRHMVMEVHSRLQKAKKDWTKQLDDYLVRSGGNGSQDLLQRPLTPFRVLLQLFAYEDVLTNGKLDAVYDRDDGRALMFFVPQLLSFLLHGAYDSSPRLEEWILDTCRRNVYFAHRCYWFLRAWSLESNATGDGRPARLSKSSSLASFENLDDSSASLDASNKFLPEERAVIEGLLHRVMTCGEEPARQLYFGSGLEPECSQTRTDNTNASPSSLMSATQSGAIPIDPSTGMPSAKHWECVAASRKYGFLPIDRALTNPKQSLGGSDASYFDTTTVFLDALLTIADNLFRVSKENRAEEFRRQLRLLEVQALPSNSIYVPLQDVNHRVWRIVEDESIAISTKERVPCIVCLEVVEYADNEKPKSRDVRRLLERVTPQESHLTMQDLTGTLSEKELINKWRYGFRDPHRRDTALEKLRYGMLHGIQQIPLDQMKTSVKAQIDKLREQKTTIKDFWTLNLPESFDDEEETSPGPLHTLEPTPSTDIERGEPDEESGTPSKPVAQLPIPRKPPVSPGLLSPHPKKNMMGQWESPSKPSGPPAAKNRQLDELLLPPRINHGSYQHTSAVDSKAVATQNIQNGSNGCLPNLLKRQDSKDFLSNTPPKPPQKPPPVVFKEAWKDKEDRLRSTSAFGSNEGWRLLPILVKANDDLRQEQLASQLIYRISLILARERVPVWLCPYEIVALTESGGIIEAIPDTISLSSLKKNDPNFTSLKGFFNSFFTDPDDLADAKANFCESLAAYSIVCFLLQIKDRHNGNILLDNRGHIIHIDFGFFFLSSPGKNTGFESAPFKLSREFVDVMGGPDSRLFSIFRMLCYRAFIALRRHCMEIIILVEMLKKGNEDLACFRGRPDDAIKELRQRFRLDLNDRACFEYVNALIDESLENWRTNWYDRYQRYCVGVL